MKTKGILLALLACVTTFTGCAFGDFINGQQSSESWICGEYCSHVDGNDDGYCDHCSSDVTMIFDFYAINDIHGKFSDSETQPGVDELTTYLKNAQAANENTILLASGDTWQGSSESNLTKGQLFTDWMNELDFAAMTLGNHEYDWGEEYIQANAEIAEFPFLAINVFDVQTNARVAYCQPSVMVEKNGVQIGIIGAIGDCYSSISPDKVSNVYFKTDSELTALVKSEARKLRNQGADLIVYSIHDGYGRSLSSVTTLQADAIDYYDVSLSDGAVDLVFEGHSHQSYVFKDEYGVYHLQGGGDNDGITHAEVDVNFAGGKSKVTKAKLVNADTYAAEEEHPVVDTLMSKYADLIAKAGEKLGMNDELRNSNVIRQTVADLYYQAGVKKWGASYEIALGGAYLTTRNPYDLHAGEIVYGDLMSLLPFDNVLVLCSIKGADLLNKFFYTNNSNYFISYGEYGANLKNNIDSNATYYIVTDRYTSLYKPNKLTEIEFYDETTYARDLYAEYIRQGNLTMQTQDLELTSIPKLLEIAEQLELNEETAKEYYVKGRIVSVEYHASYGYKYGNMTIVDENGNELYVYGTWDKTGSSRYGEMSNPPKAGDEVVLKGKMKKYYNPNTGEIKNEMMNGKIQ